MSQDCGWGKQGHAPCKIFFSNKSSFSVSRISLRSQGCHKDEVNLATLSFGDIAGYNTVVSVITLTNKSSH